jgi:hypothetical protein
MLRKLGMLTKTTIYALFGVVLVVTLSILVGGDVSDAANKAAIPSADPTSTATGNSGNTEESWQQAAHASVRKAEIAAEKAYSQLVRNVQNISLEARILAVLHEDKVSRGSDIYVNADNGFVTLTGHVDSADKARHVQEIVSNVYGVKGVKNALTLPTGAGNATPPVANSAGLAQPAYKDTASGEKEPTR